MVFKFKENGAFIPIDVLFLLGMVCSAIDV
jgi:hypothetical protein